MSELADATCDAWESVVALERLAHEGTSAKLDAALERAERAECRVQELEAEVEASTSVDLLRRYRLVCAEKAVLVQQLASANAARSAR